jgi:hypothetical protein
MGFRVVNKFCLALAALSLATLTTDIAAASGRCRVARDADNPMVSSEGFGIATCHKRGPRYFTAAYLGESARGYARRVASDPMVWSDAKWRSRLFGGYARTYDDKYDRRFRRGAVAAHVARRIERVFVTATTHIETTQTLARKARGPKIAHLRSSDGADMIENSSSFVGHRCSGILVLRWGAAGSRARCYESKGRIRMAP